MIGQPILSLLFASFALTQSALGHEMTDEDATHMEDDASAVWFEQVEAEEDPEDEFDGSEEKEVWTACSERYCEAVEMVIALPGGKPRYFPEDEGPTRELCCTWL
mmetsp:Transcript_23747/g.44871  ORF Transcript_23747/g.44871 Transcript_23747/m.44871 type:complete len:105 (+) Transcript_23747:62-376(+)